MKQVITCVHVQDSVNQLLQQYAGHLIQTEQHDLVPIYACHMRQDVRRITYASYFQSLTQRDMADCHAVYRSAWESFTRWPRGDISGETELDDIVEQVSHLFHMHDTHMNWRKMLFK